MIGGGPGYLGLVQSHLFLLQALGVGLDLIGALLLAYCFWRWPSRRDDASMRPEALIMALCESVEAYPIDRERASKLREYAAAHGAAGRDEAAREAGRELRATRAGRLGTLLIVLGFLAQGAALVLSSGA